jgi:hypothetical protein
MPICECGCGEPVTRAKRTNRGTRKGQANRYLTGHHSRIKGSPRVLKTYYEIDPDTGCWNWLKSKTSKGYGKWSAFKGLAHRIMYEKHKGLIPKGLHLDHLCRNPGCVNPDHLEPITLQENNRRRNGVYDKCPSLNFLVISAMNGLKRFFPSVPSLTTCRNHAQNAND